MQTAVEYLIDQFSRHYAIHQLQDEIEQAKEMEKQQIIDAYNKSFELRNEPYSTANKYYTKTYKS